MNDEKSKLMGECVVKERRRKDVRAYFDMEGMTEAAVSGCFYRGGRGGGILESKTGVR